MSKQDNINKLRNRNIFEEIKKQISSIKDTTSDDTKSKTPPEQETYEDIINDIFGDD